MINYPESQSTDVTLIILLIVIIFIGVRRLQKGIKGRKFRRWRIILFSLLYSIITLYVLTLDWGRFGAFIDISVLLLMVIGFMTGIRYGESVSFFRRGKELYFKRSPIILAIWTASFVVRIIFEFAFPRLLGYTEIVDGLLSFTSGLVVGEIFHILRKKKEYDMTILH